jgi:4-aminobutyrate aminotransferase/(S)-3-amino-2-methylpropionate transaminase
MDAPAPGGLGGTYAGNALSCAAALAVLDIFEHDDLVSRAVALGDTLRAGLTRLADRDPRIGDVRGLGAMLAMELVTDRATRQPDAALAQQVIDRARDGGLLLLKCGAHKNVVRLLPPLVASPADATEALAAIAAALAP